MSLSIATRYRVRQVVFAAVVNLVALIALVSVARV